MLSAAFGTWLAETGTEAGAAGALPFSAIGAEATELRALTLGLVNAFISSTAF